MSSDEGFGEREERAPVDGPVDTEVSRAEEPVSQAPAGDGSVDAADPEAAGERADADSPRDEDGDVPADDAAHDEESDEEAPSDPEAAEGDAASTGVRADEQTDADATTVLPVAGDANAGDVEEPAADPAADDSVPERASGADEGDAGADETALAADDEAHDADASAADDTAADPDATTLIPVAGDAGADDENLPGQAPEGDADATARGAAPPTADTTATGAVPLVPSDGRDAAADDVDRPGADVAASDEDDADRAAGSPADAAPEAIPTITGLFDLPHGEDPDEPEDEDEADDDEDGDADFVDEQAPQTDSIRILAEMFSGFRRRSETPQEDLQEMLGTATQSIAVIPAGAAAAPLALTAGPSAAPASPAQAATEPPTTAGAIPVAEPAETQPIETVTPEAGVTVAAQAAAAEALTRAPADSVPTEEVPVAAPGDEQQTVRTAYVPRDGGNATEQALAWLTAENVATGQTPILTSDADLVPRKRHRWVGAVFAPIVTAIVLAVVYVVAFSVWPLDNVAPTIAEAETDTPVAPPLELPWPTAGQGAIMLEGSDEILTSATEEAPLAAGPMASLTKVITVMTFLERQPLAPGEDGPSYEFGYLDQQEADALRWANESALDVPVEGELTYRQLLEGILMGSAGNYANKLVDQLWDYDRDSYQTDANAWLQENGLENTLVVDATGINPANQSTAEDMVRIAQLAMQDPTVAEIVGQDSVDLPGAGFVENSNPLLGQNGVVGIKTGHLDEWDIVSYNLMTAADVALGESDETQRVYAAIMGQPNEDAQAQTTADVLQAVSDALQPVDAMAEDTTVATVTTPWGARTDIVTDDTASLTLWDGETADVQIDYDIDLGDSAGDEVGTVTVSGQFGSDEVTLIATDDLPRPSLEWRLTHPLELLGFGA